MTQLDRAAETVRPRSPLPLILGLIAVAIGVVVVFASGRRSETPAPTGPVPAPVSTDSVVPRDSAAAPDSIPAADAPRNDPAAPHPTPADSAPESRDTSDSVRRPIGDPAALPRPRVTLPRPDSGDRR